ncbi:GtrA family protein [Devosia rhizoryzae]|uniref:GtrA family protein n=1 Tax=Devosia rhizoryzae TaxID=2774137 RepID=A0ABX7C6I4_9HYPH|nr:GtrA family protein [Devosia rhizoryzae]QQR39826.1 GtrA family protein [Devosia rhizoryzae]
MSLALESLMRETETPPVRRPDSSLVSFIAIGGGGALAFVLSSSLLIALLPWVDAWLVSSWCYAGFILPIYLLHRRFSFRSEAAHRDALPRYFAVQVLALVLASLFGQLFHGVLGLPSLPAALLIVGLTSGLNFVILKLWAFEAAPRLKVQFERN